MKEHRSEARRHDVRRPGSSPAHGPALTIVSAGHPALDRAVARAADRSAAQPPMGALRDACHRQPAIDLVGPAEGAAPMTASADLVHVGADRDDPGVRVVHVSVTRPVVARDRRYVVRVWRALPAISPN